MSSELLSNGSHPPAGTGSSHSSGTPPKAGAARAALVSAVLLGLVLTGCATQDPAGTADTATSAGGPDAGSAAVSSAAPLGFPSGESGGGEGAGDIAPAGIVAGTEAGTIRPGTNRPATAPAGAVDPHATGNGDVPTAAGAAAAAPASVATPTKDPKPAPDPADTARSKAPGGVGFEPGKPGPPEVTRPGPKPAKRIPGKPATFGGQVVYTDGVQLSTGGFKRGVVLNEGAGYFTGMPYVVIDMVLLNDSSTALDLSTVVATLRFGDKELVAQPLYGEVETADFGGTLDPGEEARATYAFLLLETAQPDTLYVDIDAQHQPATVKGKIP